MSEGTTQPAQKATGAGRGVLYIAFAKFYFMFAGLFVQVRLPALLSRAAFGAYSLVASIASFVNNVIVTGTIQTVSRFSAREPGKARAIQHAGLRMHVRLGLPIAIGFIASAPIVAHFILLDDAKTAPLMLAGLIVGGYSFYAVFVGTANGLHEFHKQAGLDISFATLRVAGLLGMAMAGLGVVGVIGGWVAAVGVILCAAVVWVGLPGKIAEGERLPVRPMIAYFASVATYLTLFNALMFVDSVLIKRFATIYFEDHAARLAGALEGTLPWAAHATGYHADPSTLADVQNAYYAAVQNLARLSYQAIIAATFVVFPLVSKSTFSEDRETTRKYIEVTSRYSLMFAMAIAVVMASNPVDVLGLVYAPDYAQLGGPALVWLAFGNVAFSVFAINGTILNGAGRTRDAIAVAGLTVALAFAGNWIAIPRAAEAGRTLEVAAIVTSGAMVVGALASFALLRRTFGAGLPLVSVVRIAIATAAAFAVGRVIPIGAVQPTGADLWEVAHRSKLMTLVVAVAVGVTFLVVLVATRELGARDLAAIKAVRKKRAPGEAS
ncbi:MAG: polysaccharide biosynthesis C-terminal domain-containing protein [Deltaproteobacteria bacterium]|nr:polysaccharide biosynthesis C-terminal domain-containing protein [Deltaproteobacteria bacterium]